MGEWMGFGAEQECGGKDVALPHLSLASLPLLTPGSHLFPLSLLCGPPAE